MVHFSAFFFTRWHNINRYYIPFFLAPFLSTDPRQGKHINKRSVLGGNPDQANFSEVQILTSEPRLQLEFLRSRMEDLASLLKDVRSFWR